MRIAIQGQAGSFHDQVARRWYGDEADVVACTTFADVFDALKNGEADAVVTAVENTIYGSINEVYQLIERSQVPIIGEYKQQIDQMLIAELGSSLESLEEIYSHPVALAQCREHLTKHAPQAELIEFFDTAGAVEYISELRSNKVAAIASEQAADMYNMPILQRSIQDNDHNITRFLILENTETDPNADRASLIVTTNHQPGALVEVLQLFADAGVNLAKLQSQPIIGKPWMYRFFMVVDAAGEPLREIVRQIEASDHKVTLLGEYRRAG